jgi:hypothetical protein
VRKLGWMAERPYDVGSLFKEDDDGLDMARIS